MAPASRRGLPAIGRRARGSGHRADAPINGPGICGANFPLKVSAFGEGTPLAFSDEPRPPGSIPQFRPAAPPPHAPDAYRPIVADPRAPMVIHPAAPPPDDAEDQPDDRLPPNYSPGPAPYRPARRSMRSFRRSGRHARPRPINAISVSPAATLACPMVSAVDRWIADSVQPAAQRWFGQPVVMIHQISAYSCRGMNGQAGAHISEHAFGNALDVAAFTLADGRKVTVKNGWRGAPEERGFLHDVHAAACAQFMTVLGPGSNAFHYDHLHLDLMRRASGRRICNPAAIPGDRVAGRPDPNVTGALSRRSPRPALGFADDEHPRLDLPRAIAGED